MVRQVSKLQVSKQSQVIVNLKIFTDRQKIGSEKAEAVKKHGTTSH